MDQVEQAVSAQPEVAPPAPEPISAIDQAVADGDQSAFKEAMRAERAGKPLPPVEAKKTPEPAPLEPAAPAPQISKRQQTINDYERRIAEQDQRIRALEAGQASPAAPRSQPQPSAPAPTPQAEYKRFLALPDAPRLEQFESVDEHTAAMSLFIADKRYEEREQQAQQVQTDARARESVTKQEDDWNARKLEQEQADPGFVDRLRPELKALRPFQWLDEQGHVIREARPTARTAIAQEIVTSPHGMDLLKHLNDHPEDFQRLSAMMPDELYPTLGEFRAQFKQAASTPPQTTRHLTAAPPPPTTLGSKPAVPADAEEAAVASGDVGGFRRAKLEKRRAEQR